MIYRTHPGVAKTMEALADDVSNLEAFLGSSLLTCGLEGADWKESDEARIEELHRRVVQSAHNLLREVGTKEPDDALAVLGMGSPSVIPRDDTPAPVRMPRSGDHVIINGQRYLVTGKNTDLMAHHVRLEVKEA